jgi:hypothetical protein
MRSLAASTFAAALLALAASAAAQPPAPNPEMGEKMRALDFLAGEWEGEAWTQMGPRRETATQRERVEWAAGGEVLLIQGQGRHGEEVVHDAIATISWDPQAKAYVMWSYRGGSGPTPNPTIAVGEKSVDWGFDSPRGKVRFAIRLDEAGRWVETGEWSGDGGTTWRPFFGMTLSKK